MATTATLYIDGFIAVALPDGIALTDTQYSNEWHIEQDGQCIGVLHHNSTADARWPECMWSIERPGTTRLYKTISAALRGAVRTYQPASGTTATKQQ
jgi:hypothetical protein